MPSWDPGNFLCDNLAKKQIFGARSDWDLKNCIFYQKVTIFLNGDKKIYLEKVSGQF